MDYNLIVIGAHNGSKMDAEVRKAAAIGDVLLVEPLPHHCSAMRDSFSHLPRVKIVEAAVSSSSGEALIHYIPDSETSDLPYWASQLGSLNAWHPASFIPQAAARVTNVNVKTISVDDLIAEFSIDAVEHLNIDTEGHDYEILRCFPFWRLKPKSIVFEHKHMDGPNMVGAKYAETLIRLVGFGYRCTVLDVENTMAKAV